jgi:hypothetical protein
MHHFIRISDSSQRLAQVKGMTRAHHYDARRDFASSLSRNATDKRVVLTS